MNQADTRQGAKRKNGAGGIRTRDTVAGTPDFKSLRRHARTTRATSNGAGTPLSRGRRTRATRKTRAIRSRVADFGRLDFRSKVDRQVDDERRFVTAIRRNHPGAVFTFLALSTGRFHIVGPRAIAQEWPDGSFMVWSNYDPRKEHAGTAFAKWVPFDVAVELVVRGAM